MVNLYTLLVWIALIAPSGHAAQESAIKDPDQWVTITHPEIRSLEVPALDLGMAPDQLKALGADPSLLSRYETFLYCKDMLSKVKKPVPIQQDEKLAGYYTFEFKKNSAGVEVSWIHHDYRGNQRVGKPFVYGPFTLEKLASHINFFAATHQVGAEGGQEFGPQEISAKLSAAGVPSEDHVKVIATLEGGKPSDTEVLRAKRDDLVRILQGRIQRCNQQGYFQTAKAKWILDDLEKLQKRANLDRAKEISCAWKSGSTAKFVRAGGAAYCIGEVECDVSAGQAPGNESRIKFSTTAACAAKVIGGSPACGDATACARDKSVEVGIVKAIGGQG